MNKSQVFEIFVKTIRSHQMLDVGDRVIVAVSGGADSVALLHLLLGVRKLFKLDLQVAHLNHNLRGENSDQDEEFVSQLAEVHQLVFHHEKIPDSSVSARRDNLEAWARKLRYEFLTQCAKDHSAQKVALGHTMNDQAETLLMRLVRGSGTSALAGIRPKRGNRFIRPLLYLEREQLQACLIEEGQTWREDESNRDKRHLRNRLRHDLLVELERRYNPKIIQAMARTAEILRCDAEALQFCVTFLFDQDAEFNGSRIEWDVKRLLSYPVGLRRSLIRHSLDQVGARTEAQGFKRLDSILNLLENGKSGKVFENNSIRCYREFQSLFLERTSARKTGKKYGYELAVPGELSLGETGSRFIATFDQSPVTERTLNRWSLKLASEELKNGFFIRNLEPGDAYYPHGFASNEKVADLLASRRISKQRRAGWPVITLGNKIICVKDFPLSTDRVRMELPNGGASVILEERMDLE